jgi:hypothetical protein
MNKHSVTAIGLFVSCGFFLATGESLKILASFFLLTVTIIYAYHAHVSAQMQDLKEELELISAILKWKLVKTHGIQQRRLLPDCVRRL